MKLLTDRGYRAYPSDYLLVRLKGRMDQCLDHIRRITPDKAREHIDMEHRWVYLQMNDRLREKLWPYFFYREIRRVFEWLRFSDISSTSLELSLLSEEIKDIFSKIRDAPLRVERLETTLRSFLKGFEGIKKSFEGGVRTFEETFVNQFLLIISRSIKYFALREFFRFMIDFRNLIGLYKHLRWRIETSPHFLSGGHIKISDLKKASLSGDPSLVQRLSAVKLNIPIDDLSELEIRLYRGLKEIMRRQCLKNPVEPFLIPYYLWSIYLEHLSKTL